MWQVDGPDIQNYTANRLVEIYRKAFVRAAQGNLEAKADVEALAAEFIHREIHTMVHLGKYLEGFVTRAVAEEDYEKAAIYRDMLLHYRLRL